MKIQVQRLRTKDVSGTPEEFDERYERRRSPEPRRQNPLKAIEKHNMSELLDRFNINESA